MQHLFILFPHSTHTIYTVLVLYPNPTHFLLILCLIIQDLFLFIYLPQLLSAASLLPILYPYLTHTLLILCLIIQDYIYLFCLSLQRLRFYGKLNSLGSKENTVRIRNSPRCCKFINCFGNSLPLTLTCREGLRTEQVRRPAFAVLTL